MSIAAILAGGKLVSDLVSGFQEENQKKEFIKNKNKAIDRAISQYIDAKDRTSLMTSDNINDMTNLAIVSKDKALSSSMIQQSAQLRSNEMAQLNSIDQAIAGLRAERPGEYEGKSGIGIAAGAAASAAMSGASIQAMIDGMSTEKVPVIDDSPDRTIPELDNDDILSQYGSNEDFIKKLLEG